MNVKKIKNLVILVGFSIIILVVSIYTIFKYILLASDNTIAATIAATSLTLGYFIIHDLENERKKQEKRLEKCLEFIKSLRFFIAETEATPDMRKKFRDDLQYAYFQFSLLISAKNYDIFKEMVRTFTDFVSENNKKLKDNKLKIFKEKQNEFINKLRREIGEEGTIEFETYDIRLENITK